MLYFTPITPLFPPNRTQTRRMRSFNILSWLFSEFPDPFLVITESPEKVNFPE